MIGVISQPLTDTMKGNSKFLGKTSYIYNTYIQWVESAGARAVPLLYDEDFSITQDKISKLNGVLYCGGSADNDEPYISFGKQVFDLAKSINDAGTFFPVWGTCLGFEDLAQYAADASKDEILT